MNDSFKVVTGQGDKAEKYINKVIPELNRGVFPKAESEQVQLNVIYKEKEYSVAMHKVSVEGFSETEELLQLPKEKEYFIAIYLKDVTELNKYIRENDAQKMVAGLIYIDNFDEVIESVEEVRQSLLVALIDRKINQYIAKIDGIVKKWRRINYWMTKDFSRVRVQLFYDGSSDGCCSVSVVTAVVSDCAAGAGLPVTSWLLAMVPLYLVAIPVCAKMMQALPNMQLYRNEMRPGQWIRTLCICIL